MDERQTRVILLAIHSHPYSFAFLQTHATSYSFTVQLLYIVKEKAYENLIENHTSFPMVKEIQTETSSLRTLKIYSRLCPGTSTKLYLHEFGFRITGAGPRGDIGGIADVRKYTTLINITYPPVVLYT